MKHRIGRKPMPSPFFPAVVPVVPHVVAPPPIHHAPVVDTVVRRTRDQDDRRRTDNVEFQTSRLVVHEAEKPLLPAITSSGVDTDDEDDDDESNYRDLDHVEEEITIPIEYGDLKMPTKRYRRPVASRKH
jgi:hypothetical protein